MKEQAPEEMFAAHIVNKEMDYKGLLQISKRKTDKVQKKNEQELPIGNLQKGKSKWPINLRKGAKYH